MFYDSYDTLANAMRHLAGESVMKGLPFDKMEKAVWEMRPLMKVIAAQKQNNKTYITIKKPRHMSWLFLYRKRELSSMSPVKSF